MEASGCAVRRVSLAPTSLLRVGRGDVRLRRAGPARVYVGGGGFSDDGHLRYYARCGGKAEKEEKRRAKLTKSLSKDLSNLMEGLAVSQGDGMVQEAASGNKMSINEAASILLAHLEESRASAKAMKKQAKEMKKAQKKALKMNNMGMCEDSSSTSSSSSESSDSDCNEQQVVNMGRLRKTTAPPQTVVDVPASLAVGTPPALPQTNTTTLQIAEQKLDSVTECCGGNSNRLLPYSAGALASGNMTAEIPLAGHLSDSFAADKLVDGASVAGGGNTQCSMLASSTKVLATGSAAAVAAPMDRIEVCVGGKCKKSGSLQLMEELQRQVGTQGAVVGCKCMGKCKEGPNVRVSHHKEDGAPPVRGPLCIGVGLEDVGAIVSSYYLGDRELGLMAAPS